LASQRKLPFHVAVADLEINENFMEPPQIGRGLLGAALSGSLTISISGTPVRLRS
jgi:hypothetical protein